MLQSRIFEEGEYLKKNCMLPLKTSYVRVHLLIPSCGSGTFHLEINMTTLAMKMLEKLKKHIFVTSLTKIA
jgi:hypothetical protein